LAITLRALDGACTSIRQAMAVPQSRQAGAAFVHEFIERKKAERFVRAVLNGQTCAMVAPLSV